MSSLGFFLLVCLVALFVAWLVNALVGVLSGEKPGDTGRLWLDVVLRIFALGRLSFVGRMLNYSGGVWPRRILYAVGALAIVIFLIRGCSE
jgi:hypothetical protein